MKAKDIKYNVNFLMNYETNSFGMDVLFSITAQGELFLRNPGHQETQINELFLQGMTQKNKEAEHFLSEYYSSGFEIPAKEEEEKEDDSFFLKEEYLVVGITIKAEDGHVKFEEEGASELVKNEEF